jgi:hypothetical protein
MHLNPRPSLLLGTTLLLMSLLVGAVIVPDTAQAAAPQHVNFSGTVPNVDLCGITTTVMYSGVDTFTPVFDSSGNLIAFKDLHQEQDTYTAANGQSVTVRTAGQHTGSLTMNPDGTVTFVSTSKGMPEQISTPNGPVLTQDVGFVSTIFLLDSSGNIISSTIIIENGPHPEKDSGFALFCQVVTDALS